MNKVLVIDFGSQYCKLIARRIREIGVFSEILPATKDNIVDLAKSYDAIILSGGPNSVFDADSLTIDPQIFNINKPILGTCYGMQIIHHLLGGKVEKLPSGEFGKVKLIIDQKHPFLDNVANNSSVWMSHFDSVTKLAPGFEIIGHTKLSNAISFSHTKNIITTQFHPEVTNTDFGKKMLENFIFKIAKLKPDWQVKSIAQTKIVKWKKIIGSEKVILGLSGGVDSSVVAALLHQAIGKNLIPIFIDNGLLRKNEVQMVKKTFEKNLNLQLEIIDAKERFYNALKDISDPETKRKIIGKVFIEEFTKAKKRHRDAKFLAQGTIYPDVIESAGIHGTAQIIKSHHNVGALPDEFDFHLCEPLRDMFKDEVRQLGLALNLPPEIVMRHPFPGPGLGIRIIGKITSEKVKILQEADDILIGHLQDTNTYNQVAQAAAILTDVKTVGVQGDQRTYNRLLALRIVNTSDFMTANFAKIDWDLLEKIANDIGNKVSGVNRVVYDITSKPPSTIEWE